MYVIPTSWCFFLCKNSMLLIVEKHWVLFLLLTTFIFLLLFLSHAAWWGLTGFEWINKTFFGLENTFWIKTNLNDHILYNNVHIYLSIMIIIFNVVICESICCYCEENPDNVIPETFSHSVFYFWTVILFWNSFALFFLNFCL